MSDIVLSAGVRQNLLSLQSTAQLMSQTQNRLATGKKVNTALDNPTNYFTSSALQSRSKDFSALLDSMSNGIKVLEAASNGIDAINRTIESMQSTLRQARQDKSFQSTSYTMNPALDTSTTRYLSFTGGAVGATPVQVALNTADSVGATRASAAAGGQFSTLASAFAAATSASHTATNVYAGSEFVGSAGSPDTITIDGQVITFEGTTNGTTPIAAAGGTDAYTLDEAISKINHDLALTASTVRASKDLAGTRLVLTNTASGTASNFAIADTTAGGNGGLGAAPIAANAISSPGTDAGTGVSFQLAVGGSSASTISITHADVLAAGLDNVTGAGINSVNLEAAINTKLTTLGITTVQAHKSPPAGVSAGTDTINLQATSVGPATTFTVSNVVGNVVGTAFTAGTGTPGTVKTVDQLVSLINNTNGLKGQIRASNDNGKLRIENLSTQNLTVTGVNASAGMIDGSGSTGTITGNQVRKNFVEQFNGFIDQLNKLADDASYNGVNLLRGDKLKITFNENGSSTIEVQARDAQGNPTSVNTNTLGITQVQAPEFDSDDKIDGRLQVLGDALGQLRSQASAFGSNLSVVQNRQDFTKSMINTLQTGADALVLADTNEEGANMLALQTRQQLSTTALSLSAQADQAVLRLFG
jgi:flagellin-like hook-associated protein FlgL